MDESPHLDGKPAMTNALIPTSEIDQVDVLIIGAGPAGLIAALWMAKCGIKTLLIDKRTADTRNGQGDGIQARTLEILDSFGLADAVWKESYHMGEMCIWNPDENGTIRRSSRMSNTIPGLSYFRQGVILAQHRVEEILLQELAKYPHIEIRRNVVPNDLSIEATKAETLDTYPVSLSLFSAGSSEKGVEASPRRPPSSINNLAPKEGCLSPHDEGYHSPEDDMPSPGQEGNSVLPCRPPICPRVDGYNSESNNEVINHSNENFKAKYERTSIVYAKYMIGCDGAHSWTRKTLGIEMHGDQSDFIWGVIDIIPITDFPDIRSRCAIHSASEGSIMLIPREGRLVRIYCQLKEVRQGESGRFDRSTITEETIFKTAQRIFMPYTLEYKYCDNWTVYQVGQRVGSHFSAPTPSNRIFLAGDAVHTHSPKAGQGMNVSMQDSYNLGWKLAHVIKGFANPELLSTYESERRAVAKELIAFDHEYSRLWSSRGSRVPKTREVGKGGDDAFKKGFIKQQLFSSGFAVQYAPGLIIAKDLRHQVQTPGTEITVAANSADLASKIEVGKRFPSARVINHSDARPWDFAKFLKADARFRIVLLAGDVACEPQMQWVHSFCSSIALLLKRQILNGKDTFASYVELLTIHSASRDAIELSDFPDVLHSFDEELGWNYDSIFVDAKSYYEPHGQAYEKWDVDRARGCVVLVRPDQHVAWIGELEDLEGLQGYFDRFVRLEQDLGS